MNLPHRGRDLPIPPEPPDLWLWLLIGLAFSLACLGVLYSWAEPDDGPVPLPPTTTWYSGPGDNTVVTP